jgi:hypothetical protein
MAKQHKVRLNTLPAILDLLLIRVDTLDAVCGSPTRCVIANCIRRTIKDPDPTWLKVNVNVVTITWKGRVHHYAIPRTALTLQELNDDGTLTLPEGKSHRLRLKLIDNEPAYNQKTDAQKAKVAARVANRRAEVAALQAADPTYKKKETTSTRIRRIAARNAGIAGHKLHVVGAKRGKAA